MVRFSVLVPVYNVERYLRQCLDSIEKQTFKDYEIIIIDDGSKDDSGLICDEYARKFDNISVYHQNNRGLLFTRRRAFSLAKGEYCVIVDSDDFIAENMLERLNDCIIQFSPDMIIIGSWKYFKGKTYIHKKWIYTESKLISGYEKNEIYEKLLSRELSNTLWTKIVKRAIVDVNTDYSDYYDVNMGEDLLQTLPLITKAESVYYLKENLYYYRTNLDSLTQNFNLSCIDSLVKVNERLDDYLPLWNLKFGNELAGYRYMVDVYDIVRSVAKTRNKEKIYFVINYFAHSSYFSKKYEEANCNKLNNRQRILVASIYKRKKHLVFAIAMLLVLQLDIKLYLNRG